MSKGIGNQGEQRNMEVMQQVTEQQSEALAEGNAVIGEKEIAEALEVLKRYQDGKANLERNIVENEEWWKMRHWNIMNENTEKNKRIEPSSAWLFNAIANKHADTMDNYPEPNILARAKDDDKAAKVLSSVLPVILEQNNYEEVYSNTSWYKLKAGTSVTGVFWDNAKQNGLGDVAIKKCDIMNLFWEPGITDIQDSANVFYVTLADNDVLKKLYPDVMNGSAGGHPEINVTKYLYNDNISTENKSAVFDWYYKKQQREENTTGVPRMKTVLHYVKFCNGHVLYASENDEMCAEGGWYAHGEYPFVFDTLFPVEGSIAGFGYIDVMKDTQMYIDKMQQAILENGIALAKPRYAVRDDVGLNQEEFTDVSNTLVHFSGNLGEDAFRQIVSTPVSSIYENILLNKIEELKDTSGNTAASQGQTSNVTSASGIASLQEASGKLSRDANKSDYRAFTKMCYLVIELVRQFYTEPRCFRITGEDGKEDYIQFDNANIAEKPQGKDFGVDLGSRKPVFDIKVVPAKQSAYTRETQNQLALQFYNMGFFAPQNVDQTKGCLDMMDFDGKAEVEERLNKSQSIFNLYMQSQQQLMALAQLVDAQNGTDYQNRIANNAQMNTANITSEGGVKNGSISDSGMRGSLSHQAASAARKSTEV